ncbi:hypothetical protein ACFWHW_11395 [Streptomyces pharetrae]|uniref:hypothetical protein n=1 Tax=Streptomyces pharetrae TaxID=291370 RepID=UPI00365F4907
MSAPTAPSLSADLFDCIQVNLAALAGRRDPHAHLAPGARLGFSPRPGRAGLPTVEPRLDDHLAAAETLLGLRVAARWTTSGRPSAADLLGEHDVVYAVADAFHLPWVPYCGRRHMEHSFLAEADAGSVTVTDAYHNDTPWGSARPGAWHLSPADLADALPEGATVVAFHHEPPDVRTPIRYDAPAPETIARYVRSYAEHEDRATALEHLTLETWLLTRARRLHAAARADTRGPDEAVEEHLADWAKLTEQTYLAHRRVQRGRPEPTGVTDRLARLLAADADVFGAHPSGPAAPATGSDLRTVVIEETAAVLRLPTEAVVGATRLSDLPAFSSFRLVEIVERLEERLELEFDPDDLVPENLHDIESLCRTAERSAKGER